MTFTESPESPKHLTRNFYFLVYPKKGIHYPYPSSSNFKAISTNAFGKAARFPGVRAFPNIIIQHSMQRPSNPVEVFINDEASKSV